MASKSNWFVVTGGPSSGIDSVLEGLAVKGYQVVPEAARTLIDEEIAKGKTLEEIRGNRAKEQEFQRRVLEIKLKTEKELPRDQTFFLDRATPDSIPYYQNCGLPTQKAREVSEANLYKRVFWLEQLPQFTKDYARIEKPRTARKISRLLKKSYGQLGYEVVRVPVMSVEDRVKLILGQMPDFRIGLATSAWDEVAWDLVKEVSQNFPIAFVFVSREEGESRYGNLMINNVRAAGLPLITFSSMRFKPWLRKLGKWLEKSLGWSLLMDFWRKLHDRQVMKRLPPTELIVLLGYMWWFGEEMCQKKTAINLHPALPDGPKGNYREVIWQLIREKAKETGVMMHLVTPELDRGPAMAFCRFSIRGDGFDPLWREMEKRLETESLEEIAEKEGESNSLFAAIRQKGVVREFPMVIEAIRALAEGKAKVEEGGYDLTFEIDRVITQKGGKR